MPRVPYVAPGRPHREAAGVAQRRAPLPQPGRHRLRLVQRSSASSRATSSGSTTCSPSAGRRPRSGDGLRRLDRALQGRRLPRRHGASTSNAAFFKVWAPKILAAARARGRARLRGLRRGLRHGQRRPLPLRPRARRAERDRLPAAGRARPVRLRLGAARTASASGSATTTTSAARPAARTRRRPSSATTTSGARRCSSRTSRRRAGRAAPRVIPRAQPALPAARRAGRLLRRRGRDHRPRRRQGGAAGHLPDPGRGVADRASGRLGADRHGSSFDVRDHPVGEHLRGSAALREGHPALSTGATVVRLAQGARSPSAASTRGQARVRGGVQRRQDAGDGDRHDLDAGEVVGAAARPGAESLSGAAGRLTLRFPRSRRCSCAPGPLSRPVRRAVRARRRGDDLGALEAGRPSRAEPAASRSPSGARAAPGAASPPTARRRTGLPRAASVSSRRARPPGRRCALAGRHGDDVARRRRRAASRCAASQSRHGGTR